MTVREKLFSELETLGKDAGLNSKKISKDLSQFLGKDEVIDYYVTQGPLPSFPDTVFDIMILSNNFLFDYDMEKQIALHHILPLKTITEITEDFDKIEDKEYLSVNFRVSALAAGLSLQGKLADSQNIRRFSGAVARKIVEST